MSEQAPVEETPETPAEPAVAVDEQPEAEAPQPEADFRKRYEDLRPEFDRKSQALSQYEQLVEGLQSDDPDTRASAAQALGLEFVDPDEVEDPDDDVDPSDRRLTALEQRIAEREQREAETAQQAEEAVLIEQAEQSIERELDAIGGLDADQREWIVNQSLLLAPTEQGFPDIPAAHVKYQAFISAEKKRWAQSKQGAVVSPVGTSATQAPDLDDPEQRVAWMTQRAAELADG